MKITGFLFVSLLAGFSFGQQNLLPISSFYKDQLFQPQQMGENVMVQYAGSSFLPISEDDYNLHALIRDSSVQYYDFTEHLFKKHLLEIKGEGYYITISPTLNLGLGKDFEDTTSRRLFNNTRGVLIEVDLLDKLSFSTSLYENQNRFTDYESTYYTLIGERYPQADSQYVAQNAIIPGGARTKPFKVDGFDYAYAIGNVVYRANKYMQFSAGNNAQFVGKGYRSLLLSDNSVPAPYFRTDVKFTPKLNYTFFRSKQFNLLRRPVYTTVEAYYEPKLYSSQYIQYQFSPNFSLGLFEGSYWNVGDSISTKAVNGAYYIPIPFVGSALVNNKNEVNSLAGLQAEYAVKINLQVYGQVALSNWETKSVGSQLGMRYYDAFGLKNAMLQLEYNNVPNQLYVSQNSRLSYSSYNLPSAHPKGNGFQEFILRANYSKKRVYGEIKSILYLVKGYQEGNLIASNTNVASRTGEIYHQQLELGYRINKRMNLEVFVQHVYRSPSFAGERNTSTVIGGIRTGLINHYNDF
jgi:hypothetical protein